MATLLQKAIELAVLAHSGSEDPAGEPYIIHPMRVMLSLSNADDSRQNEKLRCVAILHDAIERGTATAKQLTEVGMPRSVLRAVKLLTHAKNVSYADYVVALKKDALACAVKIADLQDNADLRRVIFRDGKAKDRPRLVRYAASYKYLTNQINEKAYRRMMKHGE